MVLYAAHLNAGVIMWLRCSDGYIISLFPLLHTPFSPVSISLIVSMNVKQHVYLPTGTISVQAKIRQVLKEDYNGRIVNLSQPSGSCDQAARPRAREGKKR